MLGPSSGRDASRLNYKGFSAARAELSLVGAMGMNDLISRGDLSTADFGTSERSANHFPRA